VACRHCGKAIPPKVLEQAVCWRHLCVGCRSYARRYALGPGPEAYDFVQRVLAEVRYGDVMRVWREGTFTD
jgi:hypothetical protein